MPLTDFQRRICRLLADDRRASGESYVAGGLALNELLKGTRRSKDIDVFHDYDAKLALVASWKRDCETLTNAGLSVQTHRQIETFVEAEVSEGAETTVVQWCRTARTASTHSWSTPISV